MIESFPLAFQTPWLLAGLLGLALLYWLFRLVPPKARQMVFPPLRLLRDIELEDTTPQTVPWWLVLLRLGLAGLIVAALAGPIWQPASTDIPARPVLIVLENGWTTSADWTARQETLNDILRRAETGQQPVTLLVSNPVTDAILQGSAQDISQQIPGLVPSSRPTDRQRLAAALDGLETDHGSLHWLAAPQDTQASDALADAVRKIGLPTTLYSGSQPVYALLPPDRTSDGLTLHLKRLQDDVERRLTVTGRDAQGRILFSEPVTFAEGAGEAETSLNLPLELRNDLSQISLAETQLSGAVHLLDNRWKRGKALILAPGEENAGESVLSASYYLERAISPYADPLQDSGDLATQLTGKPNLILMADQGQLPDLDRQALSAWVSDGGVLVRFAGPRLARLSGADNGIAPLSADDMLLPIRLRPVERTIGGRLNWQEPQTLRSFPEDSLFQNLTIPDDVSINGQVLARPEEATPDRVWASLQDNTPLVTARPLDNGWLVLFHVTADTSWSNLPISGLFVQMMERLTNLAQNAAAPTDARASTDQPLAPQSLLDGFGVLKPAPADSPLITLSGNGNDLFNGSITPGYYRTGTIDLAVNLLSSDSDLAPFPAETIQADKALYASEQTIELTGWFLLAAITLFVIDSLVSLLSRYALPKMTLNRATLNRSTRGLPLAMLLIGGSVLSGLSGEVRAQTLSADDTLLNAALDDRLAYVKTGHEETDAIVQLGLTGLTRALNNRTAFEPATPAALDLETDELSFYPLIYFAVEPQAPRPSARAMRRLDTFMKNGGTVLFDTRDAVITPSGGVSPAGELLQELLSGLDIPPLEPVPGNHVLTKTFYLLDLFPGRFSSADLWVEATDSETDGKKPVRVDDSVSSILITGNDLAGAWAVTADGRPLLPLGENAPWQREIALRAGVNIVMYTLTGNYKSDQVHVPALLERLGQ